MPSPESPTKRIVTVWTWTLCLLFPAVAEVDIRPASPWDGGEGAIWSGTAGDMSHTEKKVKAAKQANGLKRLGFHPRAPLEVISAVALDHVTERHFTPQHVAASARRGEAEAASAVRQPSRSGKI